MNEEMLSVEQMAEELQVHVEKADQGDEHALRMLRERLPDLADQYLVEMCGDLPRQTEEAVIRSLCGDSRAWAAGIKLKADELRSELAGTDSTLLERVLIDRLICCWIDANSADYISASRHRQEGTVAHLTFFQKKQDRAHRRFLAACKALAQVRKLMGVNVQINVAEKQINLSG